MIAIIAYIDIASPSRGIKMGAVARLNANILIQWFTLDLIKNTGKKLVIIAGSILCDNVVRKWQICMSSLITMAVII